MDIYSALKKDHQKVLKLLDKLMEEKNYLKKDELIEEIKDEVIVHAHAEQEIFYRILEQFAETERIALHGEDEHLAIEHLLKEIISLSPLSSEWRPQVEKLKKLLSHHIAEEEGTMFKEAQTVITKENAHQLADKFEAYKAKMLEGKMQLM